MSTPEGRTRTRPPRRCAAWGFLAGVAITVPATFFALLSHTGEALHPFLVPSTSLLRPLADVAATWPGPVNIAIASLVNGLVYAAVAGAFTSLLAALRHR